MPKNNRIIPLNHGEFDGFYKNITNYVAQKVSDAEWKHIPKDVLEALNDEYAVWHTAYRLTLQPHTPVETLGKRNAYKKAAKLLRLFINQYLRFAPVTDQDMLALGIRNQDSVRTKKNPPDEKIAFFFQLKKIRKLDVCFRVEGAAGKAKPHGYNGAIIAWDLLDKAPDQESELTRHVTASRTPYTLEFSEAHRGKTVYVAACWQNRKGQNGDWTQIQSAVVP
jgi:hypothetical protein